MAEGGGLLNRCRGSTPTVSSNLIPSAIPIPEHDTLSEVHRGLAGMLRCVWQMLPESQRFLTLIGRSTPARGGLLVPHAFEQLSGPRSQRR